MVVTGPPNPATYNRPSRFINSRMQVRRYFFVIFTLKLVFLIGGNCKRGHGIPTKSIASFVQSTRSSVLLR